MKRRTMFCKTSYQASVAGGGSVVIATGATHATEVLVITHFIASLSSLVSGNEWYVQSQGKAYNFAAPTGTVCFEGRPLIIQGDYLFTFINKTANPLTSVDVTVLGYYLSIDDVDSLEEQGQYTL